MRKIILISTIVIVAVGSMVWFIYLFTLQTNKPSTLTIETIPVPKTVSTSTSGASTTTQKENTSTTTSIPKDISAGSLESYKMTQEQTFLYTFNVNEVLEESGSSHLSSSKYFWLNSGAKLVITDGVGSTIMGALNLKDPWKNIYARTNPLDTDNGSFPQNLFRLITQSVWEDIDQELEFSIQKVNALNTRDRDAFSGIFLMSRYINSDTLYYAGVRMDGKVVIKKKYRGIYYTLAEAQLFTSSTPYDRVRFPNLIPTNTWYRMSSKTVTTPSGAVQIRLSFAHSLSEPLETVLVTTDTGLFWPPITSEGHTGIRTDYADVLFDNYKITTLTSSP